MNHTTGCVSLTHNLDREAAASVTLTLAVRDPGGRADSAQLAVGVADCNDNTPTFPGAAVTAKVAEGRAYFVPPLQVVVGEVGNWLVMVKLGRRKCLGC